MSKIMAEAGGSPIQWKSGAARCNGKTRLNPTYAHTQVVLAAQQDQACRGSAHRAPENGNARSASAHLAPQTAARRRPLSSSSTLLPRRRERRKWERSDVKEDAGRRVGGQRPPSTPPFFLFAIVVSFSFLLAAANVEMSRSSAQRLRCHLVLIIGRIMRRRGRGA